MAFLAAAGKPSISALDRNCSFYFGEIRDLSFKFEGNGGLDDASWTLLSLTLRLESERNVPEWLGISE